MLFGSETKVLACIRMVWDTEREIRSGNQVADFQSCDQISYSIPSSFGVVIPPYFFTKTSAVVFSDKTNTDRSTTLLSFNEYSIVRISFELICIIACDGVQDPEYVIGPTKMTHVESQESVKISSCGVSDKNVGPFGDINWLFQNNRFWIEVFCQYHCRRA
ncbi:hypothetical protein AYI69_g9240 [Smittium culicis]|uniref:Uncharacterized protein n=1 Tax=Smittium culicis TaxID=133412 RepID=A0A1R1XE20_9FUNG|nr:hypothetical protein AYI69_g9240 [Smittium culicis]